VPGVAIRVAAHYEGPPGIANGGWVAGLAAGLLTGPDPAGPIVVTLRAPVPVGSTVVGECGTDRAVLVDGAGSVLVEACRVDGMPPPPAFVPVAAAAAAGAPGVRVESPFPRCFVCGPGRAGGLHIAVGPVTTGAAPGGAAPVPYATVWTPPTAAGPLPARYVWAALDCPTGFVHLARGGAALLGRFTVTLHRGPVPGEPHVLVAHATGQERRKRFATAGLYTAAGDLVGQSAATWLIPR
jgi:hypothetical protein